MTTSTQRSPSLEELANERHHQPVGPWTARLVVVLFLLFLTAWPAHLLRREAVSSLFPKLWEGLREATRESGALLVKNQRAQKAIQDFDKALEESAGITTLFLPVWQPMMNALGRGNGKALVGKNGWLELGVDFSFVTGAPFLDERKLARSSEADPRRPLIRFAQDLGQRGIKLWVVPVPTRLMIHPEALAPGLPAALEPPNNPSYAVLKRDLEAAGLRFFDLVPTLRRLATEEKAFLQLDTHWTPAAVDRSAAALAAALETEVPLKARDASWQRRVGSSPYSGDLARMLQIPPVFTVEVANVVAANGEVWRKGPDAEVLVLGDSFLNIFSDTGGGFSAQLAYHLGRRVDEIALNGGGACFTRLKLKTELVQGLRSLDKVKVVVVEFAVRDLDLGGWWRIVRLPPGNPRPAPLEDKVEAIFADGFEKGGLDSWSQ